MAQLGFYFPSNAYACYKDTRSDNCVKICNCVRAKLLEEAITGAYCALDPQNKPIVKFANGCKYYTYKDVDTKIVAPCSKGLR